MSQAPSNLELRRFIEEIGLAFSLAGGPPMTGRLLGHLLICEPAEQTAAELADALQASRGSISTTSRQLLQAGLIEKVPRPGSRAIAYRLRDDAWEHILKGREAHFRIIRQRAEQGLALLEHAPAARRARLQRFVDFYRFFEQAFPRLVQEFLDTLESES